MIRIGKGAAYRILRACLVKMIEAKMFQNASIFRSFEANSKLYLTEMIGKWRRFGAFAADLFFTRQALSMLFLALSAEAAPDDFPLKEPHESIHPNIEERPPWEEGSVNIPPYPQDSDLIEVHLNQPVAKFRYFIDAANLTVGKDGVVNYTLITRSNSGAKNVAFERMRCSTNEYKVAAYGTSKEEMRPVRTQEWRKLLNKSSMRFRYDLWEYYLCNTEAGRIRSAKQIIDAIRFYRRGQQDRGFLAPR